MLASGHPGPIFSVSVTTHIDSCLVIKHVLNIHSTKGLLMVEKETNKRFLFYFLM